MENEKQIALLLKLLKKKMTYLVISLLSGISFIVFLSIILYKGTDGLRTIQNVMNGSLKLYTIMMVVSGIIATICDFIVIYYEFKIKKYKKQIT